MQSFNLTPVQYSGQKYTIDAVPLGAKRNGGNLSLVSAPKGLGNGEYITLETSGTGRPKISRANYDSDLPVSWLAKLSAKNKQALGKGIIYIPRIDFHTVQILSYGVGYYNPTKSEGYLELLLHVKPSPGYSIPIIVDDGCPVCYESNRRNIRGYVFSTAEVAILDFETLYGLTDISSLDTPSNSYIKLSIDSLPEVQNAA
jgi:hypothetical protein